MRHLFLTSLWVVLAASAASAQSCDTRFTIKPGNCPSCVIVCLKPDYAGTNVVFSNITFTLSIGNMGTLLTTATPINNALSNMSFALDNEQTDLSDPNGRIYYDFSASNSNPAASTGISFAAGQELPIVEVAFSNGVGSSIIQLNDFYNGNGSSGTGAIPVGGLSGLTTVYASIAGPGCDGNGALTNMTGTNLFYAVPGISAVGGSGTAQFVALVSSIVLPVEITRFDAQNIGNSSALLSWSAHQETNIADYTIERSADGRSYDRVVGTVPASGSVEYEIRDLAPLSGDNFYRLKITGKDGSTRFITRTLWFQDRGDIRIAQSRANKTISVTNAESGLAQLSVYNLLGQKMDIATVVSGLTVTFSTADFASGTYVLQVNGGRGAKTIKFAVAE
jgi:hypothetical protein